MREITLTFPALALARLLSEGIQGQYKRNLGVEVKLQPMEFQAFGAWRQSRKNEKFDAYFGWWESTGLPDPVGYANTLWESSSDRYMTPLEDPEYDEIVNQARGELDPAKRKAAYERAEKIVMDASPFMPIYHLREAYVIKPWLSGGEKAHLLGSTARFWKDPDIMLLKH